MRMLPEQGKIADLLAYGLVVSGATCPHRRRTRSAAEFLDHVVVCSDCSADLVEESALPTAEAGWMKAARRSGNDAQPLKEGQRRKRWKRAFGVARGRARGAIAALIVTGGMRAFGLLAAAWQMSLWDRIADGETSISTLELSQSLFRIAVIAELAMMAVTAVMFVRWLSHTVSVAASAGCSGAPLTAALVGASWRTWWPSLRQ